MSRTNGNIVLSREDANRLVCSLITPSEEYLMYRDGLFNQMDKDISIQSYGSGYIANISELDLSFIDETDNRQESISTIDYEINTVIFPFSYPIEFENYDEAFGLGHNKSMSSSICFDYGPIGANTKHSFLFQDNQFNIKYMNIAA